MSLSHLLSELKQFFSGELGRVAGTLLIISVSLYANRVLARWVNLTAPETLTGIARRKQREKLVWSKNLVFMGASIAVLALWASKIAGLALSLAAVAGGILIVSKEFLMCVLGYVMLTLARPYRVGAYIEVAGMSGRVIDIDLFTTTLAETGPAHQITGKSLTFPNSMVLSQAIRDTSATGEYIVDLYTIAVPFDIDLVRAERAALQAAEKVTEGWRARAEEHLSHLESNDFVDLPSANAKVLWESCDAKQRNLVVRFTCPMDQRVTAEQAVYREFWAIYGKTEANPRRVQRRPRQR